MTKSSGGEALTGRPAGSERSGYLPSLDGWRALAILAVLMDHDDPWSLHGHSNAEWHEYGGWGVYLFFAISGLLVCTRILEDEAALGRFRVKDFYIRRLFRIQPAALVYVAAIALLSWAEIAHERVSALLGALFLYQNYLFHAADTTGRWFLTGHFWTLSVEEHFYLLLSLLLFWCRRCRVRVFVVVIAVDLLWCWAVPRYLQLYDSMNRARYTEFTIQFLLVPAIFALLLQRPRFRAFMVRYLHPWVAFGGTLLLKQAVLVLRPLPPAQQHRMMWWILSHPPLLFYGFQFWVVATMLHPRSWTTRALEWKPLRFLGRLSYSIYLWHVLFLVRGPAASGIHARWLLVLAERPWRYIATGVMALLSFYLVEKPMIRLSHRLAPPATPGHKDLQGAVPAGHLVEPSGAAGAG